MEQGLFKLENIKTTSFWMSSLSAIASAVPQSLIDTGLNGGYGNTAAWIFGVIAVVRIVHLPAIPRYFSVSGR